MKCARLKKADYHTGCNLCGENIPVNTIHFHLENHSKDFYAHSFDICLDCTKNMNVELTKALLRHSIREAKLNKTEKTCS